MKRVMLARPMRGIPNRMGTKLLVDRQKGIKKEIKLVLGIWNYRTQSQPPLRPSRFDASAQIKGLGLSKIRYPEVLGNFQCC